ncbi:hypothetical protein QR680_012099 [Steinernema hermaphroditum]|uniref:3-hydroxyisobutyrate dehydrogenase n=1 Tax=Steinernema hermaphroditum TaxID=289476 RepID=A0AA39I0W5_9BILA|nr:hypothetical protein QR680_012099 [Steinernema hermaphroditum]
MSAVELRTRGNDFFKRRMFHEDIKCYRESLQLSVSTLTQANLAEAHLQQGDFKSAYGMADAAVTNDEGNVKARYRRARAALKLGLLRQARLDCKKLLEGDPNNTEFRKLSDEIANEMKLIIRDDYDQVSEFAAKYVRRQILDYGTGPGRCFTLGLPTGSTPLGMYKKLIEFCKEGSLSFEYVITFNMDEYVGLPRNHPESYHSFMFQNFFRHINIDPKNVHILDGNAKDLVKECEEYERKIKEAGGIRLFVGGIGPDGHIAFNEPGSSLTSRTRIKTLARDTILANARFFGNDISQVPTQALTVGVGTVMDAYEVMILISGAGKAFALHQAIECGVSHMWTVSAFQMHARTTFVADEDATEELRVKTVRYFKGLMETHLKLIDRSTGCAEMTSLVGFIGLGNMGAHMARNLIKNGVKLVVFDVNAARVAELKSDGADVAHHPADVAAATKTIVTMLPSSPHVRAVYGTTPEGADSGLLARMQPGTLCMDSSTIDQSASIEIAAAVQKKQSSFVDAPVSGGVVGAQNATLTFMVGGDDASFKAASKHLKMMGNNIVHCGKVGNGQAAKICNNMLLGIHMIGVAETMNLGMRMGLDSKQLASIINTSSGRCWASDSYNPVPGVIEGIPPSKGYAGGFGSALMAKDLGLAQNASTEVHAPTPMGSLAHQIYRLLASNPQYKNLDFGVVYQFLKEQVEKN